MRCVHLLSACFHRANLIRLHSLLPRGCMIDNSNLWIQMTRLRDIPTFFEALGSSLLQINSHLKKTWRTACFEPQSEDENFYEWSKWSPSELAGRYWALIYFSGNYHFVFPTKLCKEEVHIETYPQDIEIVPQNYVNTFQCMSFFLFWHYFFPWSCALSKKLQMRSKNYFWTLKSIFETATNLHIV